MSHSLRAEKEFGLIVGGIFTLLSAWWLYRGKFSNLAPFTLGLGLVLVILGTVVPRSLIYPHRIWMLLAEALGYVATRIILAIVFFLIITPIGLVKRLFGWDPLGRRSQPAHSYWRPYSTRQRSRQHYEKMF